MPVGRLARMARAMGSPEALALLRIAWPMMLAQGGMIFMGAVDTFYAGRVSPLTLGGVALGNTWVSVVMAAGIGLAMGLEPWVAQAKGRSDGTRALRWLGQGLWLSALATVPLAGLSLVFLVSFEWMGVSLPIAEQAKSYVLARLPGHFFCFAFSTYRSFLSASGTTRPVMWAVGFGNIANAGLDHLLVWEWGMGAAGVGWATSVCWMLMWAAAWLIVRDRHRNEPREGRGPARRELGSLVRLGLPIGCQLALEVAIFAAVGTLVASEGAVALAAHQIALMLAALTFMTATGVAIAATARVGQWVGANDPIRAGRAGWTAMAVGSGIMAVGGVAFWLFGAPLTRMFSPDDEAVVRMGADLLKLAAVFAVFDGLQAVGAGALRGLGDTAFTFVANVIGHWAVGFPVALAVGWGAGLGAEGYWWGLVAGLASVAVMLVLRFRWILSRPLVPLESTQAI